MTLVSIVVNNFNYGLYLSRAIDSALGQSYRAVEVLVVDDGSTDQSRDIIHGYGDTVVPILKENGGQASALNAGFAQCHGDIVIFLDADDVLLPHAAQRVVDAFVTQPAAAKIQYRMEVIAEDGRRSGMIKPPHHIPLPDGYVAQQELLFPFDLAWLPTSGNAFAARVLGSILPIPEQVYGNVGADWYLTHLTPLAGPVISLNEVCAYYRVHNRNHYEQSSPSLNLPHIRQTIVYADHTRCYLQRYAEQLNLPNRPGEILSVSDVANRMTSLKLEPDQHPMVGDTLGQLLKMALIAISRRRDVSWAMRAMFAFWFALMVAAPRALARWLAEVFFFPEKRLRLNRLLGALHGSR